MVKKCFLLLFLVGISLVIALSCFAQDIENMVRNPDFEDGIVEWQLELHGEVGAVAQLKQDKDGVVGDICALVEIQTLDGSGTWWHVGLNQIGHVVEAGRTYTLAFWAKSEAKRIIGGGLAENHDPWGNWKMQDFNITLEWVEYWVTWLSAVADKNGRIRISMGQAKDKVWVDHVRFYEGQYKEEDLKGIFVGPKSVEPMHKLTVTWSKVKLNL